MFVRLSHIAVTVEAAEAEVGDLLGQELHPLSRVAEDDRLVDLQLREELEVVFELKYKIIRMLIGLLNKKTNLFSEKKVAEFLT